MNFDLAGHWQGGAIRDAGDEAIRLHGSRALDNIQIGPLESWYGATAEHVRNYIKSKQQQAINNDPNVQALAIKAGVPGFESGTANWGESRTATLTRLNAAAEAKDEKTRLKGVQEGIDAEGRAQTRQLELLGVQEKGADRRANTQLQANRDSLAAQLKSQGDQFAFTSRESSLNRRHERELAGSREDLQMQMAIMNAELADKRMAYDRETRRMDRRDRMIAQLMSGLGQLGGAFSM